MIDGTTGMAGLTIVAIVLLLCLYSYWLGVRDGAKKAKRLLGIADKEFSEKYKHLNKYLD